MREIKFRAWDTYIKSMDYSPVINGSEECYCLNNSFNGNEFMLFMQYTGLKDKNGVEIYEGDIVQYADIDMPEIGVVEYEDCGFVAKPRLGLNDEYSLLYFKERFIEVIGNIYENPELLEAQP